MRKILIILFLILFVSSCSVNAAWWNRAGKSTSGSNTSAPSSTSAAGQGNSNNNQNQATYPNDVNGTPIAEDEYVEDIDIEQMYRDLPVPTFKYIHDIDPGEYQDTMYSTWSPYPLFRLTAPLYFKTVTIMPGYYLLTPREHEGKWYILFKEAGRVKYIVPCYLKEMVPMDFYKNNLPQIKMTTAQIIREKTLKFVGEHFKSSKREPIPETYLEASDLDNNFISIVVYWGNYRYYLVLRTIQL